MEDNKPMRIIYGLLLVALSIALAGCIIKPYQVPVQQGAVISNQMIAQLKPGMSKAQVKYILGSPNVIDPYNSNVWYYVYTIQQNHLPRSEKKVIVTFDKQGKLTSIEGDYAPPSQIQYTTFKSK